MTPINRFLLQHDLRIARNPCVSPDFCLDWSALSAKLVAGAAIKVWDKSVFATAVGTWTLLEDPATGDCAWRLETHATGTKRDQLESGVPLNSSVVVLKANVPPPGAASIAVW